MMLMHFIKIVSFIAFPIIVILFGYRFWNNSLDAYLTKFFIIAGGSVILSIAFPFFVNYFFSDWQISGTFGDTFGALNALFSGLALAGVIVTILIQKSELQMQRKEMQDTRKEFLINRATNLVYIQLDRFEKYLSELTINHSSKTYTANDATSFLDENKEKVYNTLDKLEDQYNAEMKASIIKLLKIYTPNKYDIQKFAHNANNSVEVLKRIIYNTNLEIVELNDLKALFFDNIGFVKMGVIERISEVADNELKFLTSEDYVSNGLDIGKLSISNIFLKSIMEFYNLQLTKENFEEQKTKWKDSRGGRA